MIRASRTRRQSCTRLGWTDGIARVPGSHFTLRRNARVRMPEPRQEHEPSIGRLEQIDERRGHQLAPEVGEIELDRRGSSERGFSVMLDCGGRGAEEAEGEQCR